ncbi:hypothetical protein [Mycobacteroides abscessus]|nr:hypothetical protein [Mycobacteroides abscessus]
MVMSDRWRMSPALRRTSAVIAIAALVIGGAKIASDHTMPGSGFSTVATVAADPTGGPTGGPGGPDGMNGGAFQPPGLPPQQPDYQGGINQPPLDQNSGISIYNTGSPGAQQVPGQQGAQQPQQAQQPAHGTQIPDYQTATPYTQGPGKANPDYQAPQQGNQAQQPQQGQQPQQQQPQQREPDQQPQNKQDQDTQQLNERQQKCQAVAQSTGMDLNTGEALSTGLDLLSMATDGAGSLFDGPSRGRIDPRTAPDPGPVAPGGGCSICPPNSVEHYNYQNGELTKLDTGPTTYNIDNLKKSMAGLCIGPTEQATGKCTWGDAGRCLAAITKLGLDIAAIKGTWSAAKSLGNIVGKSPELAKEATKLADILEGIFTGINKIPDLTTTQKVAAFVGAVASSVELYDQIKKIADMVEGVFKDIVEVPSRCGKLF